MVRQWKSLYQRGYLCYRFRENNINGSCSMDKDHDKNQTRTASPEWVTSLPEARDPDTCQMVVVAATGMDKTTASISMLERDADGRWVRVLSTPGFVGEDGLCMDEEHRGDGPNCTPIGTYKFNKAFGIADDPGCNVFDYVKVDNDIYWSHILLFEY